MISKSEYAAGDAGSPRIINTETWHTQHLHMIHYTYKKSEILFVGINPHFGSFNRGVPFSNNKLFWYLLSEAGIIEEKREELRNDETLKRIYKEKFNAVYGLGLVNIINRPTQDVTKLNKGEELPGRKKISRIIKAETPKVVCFIGKVTYEKYTGLKDFSFGWQDTIGKSKVFVMHFPLRGEAIIRIRELREVARATQD
jgi:double-stranded uracil-DNA glycosylase